MQELTKFLESSTIHGLSHISVTHRNARLFWILIVLLGFAGASILIQMSFQSWSDKPISTTVETLPIDQIEFPKVTICPPKDTLTDLNEVLLGIGNKTFEYDTLDESTTGYQVLEKFTTFFQNEDYKRRLSKVGAFYENERYRKWYQWDSSARFPAEDGDVEGIITMATSGNISTPYFKEKLDFDKYEQLKTYVVTIQSPFSEGATLLLNLEYDVLERNYECITVSVLQHSPISDCLNSEENFKQIKIEVKGVETTYISFKRRTYLSKTSMTEILKKRVFTGFQLSWNVTTDATINEQKYPWYRTIHNHVFIGFANLAQELEESQHTEFWKVLRYTFNT